MGTTQLNPRMDLSDELDEPELGAREQALLGLVDTLTPEDRELLELRLIDGFTTLDIAARFGISRADGGATHPSAEMAAPAHGQGDGSHEAGNHLGSKTPQEVAGYRPFRVTTPPR